MLDSYAPLIGELVASTEHDPFWADYLRPLAADGSSSFALHLAVFVEPYLQFVLEGRKTIESRFSTHKLAPFGHVRGGDVLLLKKSGGPIVGLSLISDVWFYQLDPESWSEIKEQYAQAICAQDPEFWEQRKHASFATLMRVKHSRVIRQLHISKRDRRGWVVLLPRATAEANIVTRAHEQG